MESESRRTVSVPQACEILHCKRSTIYNRIAADPTFPRPFRIGRESVWYAYELEAYVARCASRRHVEQVEA